MRTAFGIVVSVLAIGFGLYFFSADGQLQLQAAFTPDKVETFTCSNQTVISARVRTVVIPGNSFELGTHSRLSTETDLSFSVGGQEISRPYSSSLSQFFFEPPGGYHFDTIYIIDQTVPLPKEQTLKIGIVLTPQDATAASTRAIAECIGEKQFEVSKVQINCNDNTTDTPKCIYPVFGWIAYTHEKLEKNYRTPVRSFTCSGGATVRTQGDDLLFSPTGKNTDIRSVGTMLFDGTLKYAIYSGNLAPEFKALDKSACSDQFGERLSDFVSGLAPHIENITR